MPWQIQLFGILEARGAEGQTETWRGTKAGLLLAYLALHPDRPHSRESLAEFLWPDGDPATKRTRLRQEIAALRVAFEEGESSDTGLLSVTRTDVSLPATAKTDVARFDLALARALKSPDPTTKVAALQEAIFLYRAEAVLSPVCSVVMIITLWEAIVP